MGDSPEVLFVFIDVLKLSEEGCVRFDCGNVFLKNFELVWVRLVEINDDYTCNKPFYV